jgi:glucosylglycerate synthase
MARIEFSEETKKRIEEIGTADLVIGITGSPGIDLLHEKLPKDLPEKTVVAFAGAADGSSLPVSEIGAEFLRYPWTTVDPTAAPWWDISNAQRSILALGASLQARACIVLHSDLSALDAQTLQLLTGPILEEKCELVTPIYPEGPYDGLLNKSILSPLSRALYGRRVHTPLPSDFSAAGHVLDKLADTGLAHTQAEPQLLWPSNKIAMDTGRLCQMHLPIKHSTQTEGLDLSAVLTQLVGSLFAEVEACAPYWQRVRASQPAEILGTTEGSDNNPGANPSIDTRPMVESFLLGSSSLEEVWRVVLPPATLLDLRRMTRMPHEIFRMPDDLWARIVYDFALAYRMRRISRSHLLGALTPLYLGWAASYTQQVGGISREAADQRIEQVSRAYEENKAYLVSRWRWPDRLA